MNSTAYLVAIFDQSPGSLTLLGCRIYSEWPVSQVWGRFCKVQMLAHDVKRATFDEARRECIADIWRHNHLEWARPYFPREVRP